GLTYLLAFGLAVLFASQVVFGDPFPWQRVPVWPLLGFMTASMIVMSFLTGWMSGPGVPRPTYGRMAVIALGTWLMTSALLVVFREVYFSRQLIILSILFWIVPATLHRVVRRQRPWTERIAIITREKQLADELLESD